MPGTVLSEHSSKENRQGFSFLVMVKGKKKKRHWKSLKGKARNKSPGYGNPRKLPFCSIVKEESEI